MRAPDPILDRRRAAAIAPAWVLVNASPDILRAAAGPIPVLQPARALRDTAIVRHRAGGRPDRSHDRPVHAARVDPTAADLVHRQHCADLTQGNPILGVLAHYCGVERRALRARCSDFVRRRCSGDLQWRALAVASKPAPYSPHREAPRARRQRGARDRGPASGRNARVCAGAWAPWRRACGTRCRRPTACWWTARSGRDDEMIALGLSRKRGAGHRPPAAKRRRAACSSGSTGCPRARAGS